MNAKTRRGRASVAQSADRSRRHAPTVARGTGVVRNSGRASDARHVFSFSVHQHHHADSLNSAKAYPAMMASRKNPALNSTKQILRHRLLCRRKREACIARKSYATFS